MFFPQHERGTIIDQLGEYNGLQTKQHFTKQNNTLQNKTNQNKTKLIVKKSNKY